MNRDTELSLMRRALAHIDAGTTDLSDSVYYLAAEAYTSPMRLELESERLFRGLPIVVGLSHQLPAPGSYFCDDLSGVPVLVTRGDDGQARVFLNICRHRAARVVEGSGQARSFSCPYHAWTYSIDGSLRSIPDERNFPGVSREANGLMELPSTERHGLIWARLRPDPATLTGAAASVGATAAPGPVKTSLDVADFLGALDTELGHYGFGKFYGYQTREIQIRANWKMALDTFLEPYHLGALHRKTVARLIISNLCLFDGFGCHSRVAYIRHSIHDERKLPPADWSFKRQSAIVYVLFPNTVLIWQLDHAEIWRFFPVPGRPDQCRMVLDFLIPEPATSEAAHAHWQRNLDVTVATVLEEDFPTMEGIMRNLQAGGAEHVVFGRTEPGLTHFERVVTEWVAA